MDEDIREITRGKVIITPHMWRMADDLDQASNNNNNISLLNSHTIHQINTIPGIIITTTATIIINKIIEEGDIHRNKDNQLWTWRQLDKSEHNINLLSRMLLKVVVVLLFLATYLKTTNTEIIRINISFLLSKQSRRYRRLAIWIRLHTTMRRNLIKLRKSMSRQSNQMILIKKSMIRLKPLESNSKRNEKKKEKRDQLKNCSVCCLLFDWMIKCIWRGENNTYFESILPKIWGEGGETKNYP